MQNRNTFEEIIEYMSRFTNLEKNTGHYNTRNYRLDRMNALLEHFSHPERNFKSIHVAGSKGKGSTSKFIAMGLKSQGFKVGLYASPHLVDYRERFTLCGEFFKESFLIETGNYMISNLNNFSFSDEWGEIQPTTFELFTLFGFLLFSFYNCDYAVIETGLGGRLDATNTITPIISVLCPIEKEHTNVLGKTITEIAIEKSKIIKKNVPSVIASLRDEAKQVMINEAKNQNSTIHILEDYLLAVDSKTDLDGEEATLKWSNGEINKLHLSLKGKVMAKNCALAILTLKTLGFNNPSLLKELEKVTLRGRFETLKKSPYLYIDGAHTPVSIGSLISTIQQIHERESITIIFGAILEKDHIHIAQLIVENFDRIIISKPGTFKKSDPLALLNLFNSIKKPNQLVELIEDADLALHRAEELTKKSGAILCCGSFYMASEITKAYERENKCL